MKNGISRLTKIPLDSHNGAFEDRMRKNGFMIHVGTSKTDVKNKWKFEHLNVGPCVESLALKRKL